MTGLRARCCTTALVSQTVNKDGCDRSLSDSDLSYTASDSDADAFLRRGRGNLGRARKQCHVPLAARHPARRERMVRGARIHRQPAEDGNLQPDAGSGKKATKWKPSATRRFSRRWRY